MVPEITAAHQARDSHESYTPLLPEQGDQLLENNFDSAIALARGCNSAVDALLCWIDFAEHDEPLNSTRGKRITTNCASLWAYRGGGRENTFFEVLVRAQ